MHIRTNQLLHFDLQYRLPKDPGPKRALINDFRFQRFENQEPFLFFKVEIYKQFYFEKIQIKIKSISLYNLTLKNKNGSWFSNLWNLKSLIKALFGPRSLGRRYCKSKCIKWFIRICIWSHVTCKKTSPKKKYSNF